jgi:sugar phosphate isomerase/epimerase
LTAQFGTVQGRLIKPPNNELQWFPQDAWESEFYLAKALGFNYIELIAERNHNPANPIWTSEGVEKINQLCKQNNLSRYAICNDYIIDHGLIKDSSGKVFEQMKDFANQAARLNMKIIILPLFEHSELNEQNMQDFLPLLQNYAGFVHNLGMEICLETILSGKTLKAYIHSLEQPNIKCVFDTGNRVAHGHDIYSDIKLLGEDIGHVHIKDKNANDENVVLGDGLVNFYGVFRSLSQIGYKKHFTFETNRGTNPVKTAMFNLAFCQYSMTEVDFK